MRWVNGFEGPNYGKRGSASGRGTMWQSAWAAAGEKSVANVVSLHAPEEEEGWPTQASQNVSCDSWRVSKAGMS